ncbi:HNH endonuclease family protein [Nocardioides bruguierae]|uniref:HNH endonuclease family protein n=1 Tax=Nocardioides bruguierae TaxID=2945102 RepID=UPI0020210EF9|nr:HNH endonuclease family protein [Nocardioides bruguierae]MCL8026963.1 HNH endonuclease family protein [Nocardioides bruguierae]
MGLLGASQWPETRRRDFANDPRNLLTVSGSANSSKSDHGPREWLPVNGAYRCRYAAIYLQVAHHVLPITAADRAAVIELEPSCKTRRP